MTNEEAIVYLERADTTVYKKIKTKTAEALEMAIKALEQQPCEDCISRQALKQKLQEHHDFFVNAYGSFKDMPHDLKVRVDEITNCIAEVVNEPSVTPRTNLAETSQDCISIEPIQWYSQNKDGYLVKGAYSKDEAYVKLTDVYEKIRISEDCISREEVQDLISIWLSDYLLDETREALETINYKVGDMPAVYPERPKGKWIEYEVDVAPHPLHCSLCGFSNHHISNRYMREFRRCPNCGAEMIGGGEDENNFGR